MVTKDKAILFADDDPWFVQSLIAELQDAGYKVLRASTGTETLDTLSNEHVDLLVLDIMMPTGERLVDPAGGKRTGLKVAELVRKEMKSSVPIIYLTVVSDQAVHSAIQLLEKEAGLEPRILVKPVLPQDLVEEVQASLGET